MENLEEIEQKETLPPQSSPKKKYLLIGVITALVVLIGGTGIFVLTQKETLSQVPKVVNPGTVTQDETANWQTYRNEEFGFEIGYPTEFDIWGVSDRGISVIRRIGGKPRLTVGISVISAFGSLAEYLEHVKEVREFADEGQPSVYVIKERSNITVSGKRAFEQEIVGAASALYTIETFIEISPDLIISVIVRDDDGNAIDDSLRDLNDQILSTFRFID